MNVRVRELRGYDMASVMWIERAAYPLYGWSEAEFEDSLRSPDARGIVAEHDNKVVGYVIVEQARRSIELLNITVDRAVRRAGIGSLLVDAIKQRLTPNALNKIYTVVAETNLDGHFFFSRTGFVATAVL